LDFLSKNQQKEIKKRTKGVVVVFPASRKGLKSYSMLKTGLAIKICNYYIFVYQGREIIL
jgi:hypothetical protein